MLARAGDRLRALPGERASRGRESKRCRAHSGDREHAETNSRSHRAVLSPACHLTLRGRRSDGESLSAPRRVIAKLAAAHNIARMDFDLSDEQRLLRDTVREFARA